MPSTTAAGAFSTNFGLPSFFSAVSSSFCAAARSRPSRARSAATSIAPEVSSSTCTGPPDSTTSTVAVGAKPSPGASSRASDCSAVRDSADATPTARAATRRLSGMPCSVRNRRTSVTSFCRSTIRVAAAASTGAPTSTGHGATTTDSPPVSAVHRVSVMNGATGCSSLSSASRTCPSTARVPSAVSARSCALASSTYQSQNSPHVKW